MFTEDAVYVNEKSGQPETPWNPTPRRVGDVVKMLSSHTHREDVPHPGWLGSFAPSVQVVSCANGLLDLGSRSLKPHHPEYFNLVSVPFAYDPAATASAWLSFVSDLQIGEDSIRALQEWFGYIVSGRTDFQKILLLIGPTRAGKGVITRILTRLIGPGNVAGPTLASLSQNFGLSPLLSKTMAVVSDARLSGRGNSTVVERLLSISGQDAMTVDRKYREPWFGPLPTRLVIASNELPALDDASGAIVGRFLPITLTQSHYGSEDRGLEARLALELPGILNWALVGLDRLEAQGRFTRPDGADGIVTALRGLASPLTAFLEECCTLDPELRTPKDMLWLAWERWCDTNGEKSGTRQTFVNALRSLVPFFTAEARMPGGRDRKRAKAYSGLSLR